MENTFANLAILAKATQLTSNEKKKLVLLTVKDHHLSELRKEFNQLQGIMDSLTKEGVIFPSEFHWLNDDWFLYILVKSQLYPTALNNNEKAHLKGLEPWLKENTTPCSICGSPPLAVTCKGTDAYPDVYLQWSSGDEENREEELEEETKPTEIGVTYSCWRDVNQPPLFISENSHHVFYSSSD